MTFQTNLVYECKASSTSLGSNLVRTCALNARAFPMEARGERGLEPRLVLPPIHLATTWCCSTKCVRHGRRGIGEGLGSKKIGGEGGGVIGELRLKLVELIRHSTHRSSQ